AMLARRREPARLLVVGTDRPADVIASRHPLRALVRELEAHAQCRGLPLGFLTPPEVCHYLAARFVPPEPQAVLLEAWGRFIHGRTDGNPLFMVAMVDDLMGRGVIGEAAAERPWPPPSADVAGELPESLRQLIDHQFDRLSQAERGVIEAASVAGMEFSAPWVAAALETEAGLGKDVAVVEAQCEELARRHQFIRDCGFHQLPNGEVAARYGFIHALYQDVLYERVPAAKRVHLHRRVGEREEELYGERAGEIAAELAMHFERGRDHRRAVKYLGQAAETAIRRFAYQEAIVLARQGLELLQTLPDTSERVHQELRLHIALGVPLTVTQGFAAPDVGRAYARALELCERLGETAEIFQVLWGLRGFHMVRAELETARELAERILRLAQDVQDPALRV
ncbi:MAG: hypothetical protein ACREXU_19195, partial [Gammaproteobacteria bacterium]